MSKMLRCSLLVYLLLSLLWASSVYAQNLAPIHAIDGEYVREWLVLGPFFPSEMERDFLTEAGGEANIEPKEGDTVTSSDGRTLTWERYKSKRDIIDLINPIGNYVNASVYAFCILQSHTTGDAQIHLESYGGLAVWINGERVHLISSDRYVLDWGIFEAKLKVGANRCLIKMSNRSRYWAAGLRAEMLPVDRAIISGMITDEEGNLIPEATVRLEQDGEEIVKTRTVASGSYRLNIYPPRGTYDLIAEEGERSSWQSDIHLSKKERRKIDLTLRRVVSIEGTLLMLDDRTPHVSVPVQAMRDGKAIATALSDEGGRYRLINLKPGRYQVRCQILNGYVYYEKVGNGRKWDYQKVRRITSKQGNEMSSSPATSIGFSSLGDFVEVEEGKSLSNIDFRFAHFKKGTWGNYNTFDGLASGTVNAIYRDPDGVMWLGTEAGVSRYDWGKFINLTTEHGLVHNRVLSINRDSRGIMWFGTWGGVSRYDGKEFVNLTTRDRFPPGEFVQAIHRDPDGVIWFGTVWNGVFRYDGKQFTNLTTKDGLANNQVLSIHRDPDGMMWFGTLGGGVSRYDGRTFANLTTKDGLASNYVCAIHRDTDGVIWFGTQGGVSRYDGKEFVNLTTKDGLVDNDVFAIHSDPDGVVWFGTSVSETGGRGISRYDGETFVNFTTEDGLAGNDVHSIHRDPDGIMWFGTYGGGVSRYDGRTFANFTTKDGLGANNVRAIHRDPDGMMWFGTLGGGVSRYDGKTFVNLTTEDGLAGDDVYAIHSDPDDTMWFGTEVGGVSRYDGSGFINLIRDGVARNAISFIHRDPDGVMWFGTWDGVSRYDGEKFRDFTTEDGLAGHYVGAIHRDPDGVMWFGTWDGVSRYDGREFVNFTIEDGLAQNTVRAIYRDSNGMIWFGTLGGVSCYDGTAWTSLDTRDGLAGRSVYAIHQDPEGSLWFGTDGGVTRYRRDAAPPQIQIVSVTADDIYRNLSSIPAFATGTRITIEYGTIDFKTIPEKRQYRCRVYKIQDSRHKTQDEELKTRDSLESGVLSPGSGEAYLAPTKDTTFDWRPRKPGAYVFEVQAIDRDLNYSKPASLTLGIVPPFYMRASFLVPTMGSAAVLILITIASATAYFRHRGQVRAYQQAAVEELRDAHEMQIALLPEAAPPVEGMEVAGRSIPANTVGGDFFDYLELADRRVGIAIADVSGKGLRAAMNAVLADGMMHEVATIEASCSRILSRLNAHLYPLMEKQMFTAFSFAILGQDAGVIQWSNAGQPLPLIKRSDGVSEAEEHGELPLGMVPDVEYPDYELKLQADDLVIFYTDGVIEAENETEEMYGTERLLSLVAGMDSASSAEDAIGAILQDVAYFVGDAEQYDDMTVVVMKKLA